MKRLLDRFFIARIDRALDDAAPLDSWTARYVRGRPELLDYYESMLELEIELRFPEADIAVSPSATKQIRTDFRPAAAFYFRAAASALVAAILVLAVAISYRLSSFSTSTEDFAAAEQKIDPAELIALGDSLRNTVSENIVRREPLTVRDVMPSFEFPVDSIVAFTEQPIGSTFALLERFCVLDKETDDL